MRRVTILDPGLFSNGSHNFNCDLALTKELRRRGHDVQIFGYRWADPQVIAATGAIPHFEQLLWNRVDTARPFDEELNWIEMNRSFQTDLENLGDSIVGTDRILLIPNILQHQIAGFARWFRAIPDSRKPAIIINLMFFPRWTAWSDQAVRGAEFYLRAIEDVRPWLGSRIVLCAENNDIAAFYRELLQADITITPVPIEPPVHFRRRSEGGPLRLGFIGYSKNEKGFPLLPHALDACMRDYSHVRALVQIHHHGSEPESMAADERLGRMSRVDIVRGSVEKALYYALLDSCDIVLLPYDPVHYNTRGSGVLSEAIAYGKPIVASNKTWAGNAIQRSECAGVACDFDEISMGAGMREAIANFPALKDKAQHFAAGWLKHNSVSVYCDVVEKFDYRTPTMTFSLSEEASDSLDGAFPVWPREFRPLPKPCGNFGNATAGVDWDSNGAATIAGPTAQIALLLPFEGAPVSIELVLHSEGVGSAVVFLNGHQLGIARYTASQNVMTLPLPTHGFSSHLPCMLAIRLDAGASPFVIEAVRVATRNTSITPSSSELLRRLLRPLTALTSR